MKKFLGLICLLICVVATAAADDLYKVTLHSQKDAEALKASGAEVLLWVDGGYLTLASKDQAEALNRVGLDAQLLAANVSRDQLALDDRWDRVNAERFEVLYEAEGVRLLRVDAAAMSDPENRGELLPIRDGRIEVGYYPPRTVPEVDVSYPDILVDLVDEVNQDTVYAYVCSLQAYPFRAYDQPTNTPARDWIFQKFQEFGYSLVALDPFVYNDIECDNVIACKPGSIYPEKQVIIGAHFDAVRHSPGADDNGSGTAAVMEIARVLSDVDLPMTLIFCAFDAEEEGKVGSYHYVNEAVANGDEIVYMQNMDMIGAIGNNSEVDLYHGPETGYALLWDQLGQSYAGITGILSGTSTRSDHYPFQKAGFDVCFTIEHEFSEVYHTYQDSTAYMSFDYLTRMVKANLATVYTVATLPPPVDIVSIHDPNDGQSLIIYWESLDPSDLESYLLTCYPTFDPSSPVSHVISPTDTSFIADGLTENEEYCFYVHAYNYSGQTAVSHTCAYATPSSQVEAPTDLLALPLPEAVQVFWKYEGNDLNFSHFAVYRDGLLIDESLDTSCLDDDRPGREVHSYQVATVDISGERTFALAPVYMRAATLQAGRILAVNRSSIDPYGLVDETETGAFLREALSGHNFTYLSDTAHSTNSDDTLHLDLFDMVAYEAVVIGAETADSDDIGSDPGQSGLLDSLAYYMSIGGKVVIFGRWGHGAPWVSGRSYSADPSYDNAYYDMFSIYVRWLAPVTIPSLFGDLVEADLVGAHSQNADYPTLVWDSSATVAHSNAGYLTVTEATGIPSTSFVQFRQPIPEVIYSYHSRDGASWWENAPVAWKHIGPDYQYVYFDIPLSFFEREAAKAALRQAVDDLLDYTTDAEGPVAEESLPGSLTLSQNYPNPFNPTTEIIYSLPQRSHVRLTVYNVLGRRVTTLVDADQPAGTYRVSWDGTDDKGRPVATGIYLYQMRAGERVLSKKMLLLK